MNTSLSTTPPHPAPASSPVFASRPGKARTAILLWLLGVPIPIIIIIFLIKGCMG